MPVSRGLVIVRQKLFLSAKAYSSKSFVFYDFGCDVAYKQFQFENVVFVATTSTLCVSAFDAVVKRAKHTLF